MNIPPRGVWIKVVIIVVNNKGLEREVLGVNSGTKHPHNFR